MRDFVGGLVGSLSAAIVIFLVLSLVLGNYGVDSPGMEPGMQSGEQLLVNKLAYKIHEPQRGDIVCFSSSDGHPEQVKRVIGLPGDIVEVKNGAVFLNGHQIIEPYVKRKSSYTLPQYQVPLNYFFLLDDNRDDREDSTTGWTVPAENIQGKAWILTWPPDRWGIIGHCNLSIQLATAELPD